MPKLLQLRRHDVCATCGVLLVPGTSAYWFKAERVTRCTGCHEASMSSAPANGQQAVPARVQFNAAGGSARAEYEKRAAQERRRQEQAIIRDAEWRETLKRKHRLVGPIVAAFTPKPEVGESQSTTAWKTGSEGEERVAEVLADVAGIEVLHDCPWPGTRKSNIDHIVVGPSGVFVIDAKKYSGKVEVLDKGSLFRPDFRLYVNGRNQTKLVDSVIAQSAAVRSLLGRDDIPVSGVLCFVGAEWGLFGPRKPKELKGVTILWPLKLPDFVTAQGTVDVAATAAALRSAFATAK